MSKTIHIEFPYRDLIHMINIPVDQIDINHYDNLWDWWFKPDDMPNMKEVFEVTGEKNKNHEATTNGIWINVYVDEDENVPCCEIRANIKARIV